MTRIRSNRLLEPTSRNIINWKTDFMTTDGPNVPAFIPTWIVGSKSWATTKYCNVCPAVTPVPPLSRVKFMVKSKGEPVLSVSVNFHPSVPEVLSLNVFESVERL